MRSLVRGALVLAAMFGPLAGWCEAQPQAAPSAAPAAGGAASLSALELPDLAAELVRQPGGVIDASGRNVATPALMALVEERRAKGERVWVVWLPDGTDLGGALNQIAGRVAPGPREMVVVASRNGVRARVPELSGAPKRIDAAFDASRRDLTADPDRGMVDFVKRLLVARDSEQQGERLVLWGLGGIALLVALGTLARWGRFRVSQRGWERNAAAAHARRVGACQEKLHAMASDPEYDRLYAELKELQGRKPEDAAVALDEFLKKLGGDR